MEASASFRRTRIPTGVIRTFLVALVAAFLLGGVGGYVVRSSTASTSSGTQTTNHPFVIEQAPYSSSPAVSPASAPTRDPNGNAVPI